MRVLIITLGALLVAASAASAANIKISLGIRETNNNPATTTIFSNAGSTNGIEWVNLDGQTLVTDGTWQLFTFTPATDPLTAFAGGTADGMLTPGLEIASLEHIRILNSDGITNPIRLWVDNVTNTVAAGPVVEGFEGFAVGTEVMFQEPNFSGSTSANVVAGGTALVSSSMAFGGSQSNEVNFQFVDNSPTRWVRLTTFSTPNLPNPAIRVVQPGAPAPTVSFYAKAVVIPEPCSLVLMGLAGLGLLALRRRRG